MYSTYFNNSALHYCFTVFVLILVITQALIPQESIESGKNQYQLLHERVNLPQYGTCWKQAIQHIHEGCNSLSESTQSDIALHLTNCFLEMSGHETYSCESDRKPNLRGICINSMTDRAFNVYTEFYTHTQNICWFLRRQVWQETMAENTFRVSEQLQISVKNQENLLNAQKESIEMQKNLLNHSVILQEVISGITNSLSRMHESISSLQNWLINEMSWFDTIAFYTISLLFALVLTSLQCTSASRLPVLLLLCGNIFLERLVCNFLLKYGRENSVAIAHSEIVRYIWFLRYLLIILCSTTIITSFFMYKDYSKINNVLLEKLYKQNLNLICKLEKNDYREMPQQSVLNVLNEKSLNESCNKVNKLGFEANCRLTPISVKNEFNKSNSFKSNIHKTEKLLKSPLIDEELNNRRYNLRSRQGTPNSETPVHKM